MPFVLDKGKVTLSLENGSTAVIHFQGATVTSWLAPEPGTDGPLKERLFVSKTAVLDGSEAIRGGISIAFPFFGKPQKPEHQRLAKHGFARHREWKFDGVVTDNDAGINIRLVLEPDEVLKETYPYQFSLVYVITLTTHSLSTDFHVHNTGTNDTYLEFQAMLQDYLVCDSTGITTHSAETKSTSKKPADHRFGSGSGRIFKVHSEGGGYEVKTTGFKDVNVALGTGANEDGWFLAEEEKGNFVCVKPGLTLTWHTLAPGDKWVGTQTISPSLAKVPSACNIQ
ncbi:hypothetical protein FRB94_011225 [Tulasnella sp. JGI-2019a]|nr:hypothetical protein FRB93_002401 [Tulasnella sp. JGI-2019a]KAG9009943.1 hypothetical protein FRB94_011225 [Tulasnella sp. JGI-2019a]